MQLLQLCVCLRHTNLIQIRAQSFLKPKCQTFAYFGLEFVMRFLVCLIVYLHLTLYRLQLNHENNQQISQ